jgi:hypothetical protein
MFGATLFGATLFGATTLGALVPGVTAAGAFFGRGGADGATPRLPESDAAAAAVAESARGACASVSEVLFTPLVAGNGE